MLQAKKIIFGEISLNYGAFGAKGPARAGQKTLRNFSEKVDFLGVPESKLEFG